MIQDSQNANAFSKYSFLNFIGDDKYSAISDSLSTTTQTIFQTKVQLDITNLPIGTYMIMWSYTWGYSSNTREFEAQVLVGATQVGFHRERPMNNAVAIRQQASGFFIGVNPSVGNVSIYLQYRATNAADTARIDLSRLFVMRVA